MPTLPLCAIIQASRDSSVTRAAQRARGLTLADSGSIWIPQGKVPDKDLVPRESCHVDTSDWLMQPVHPSKYDESLIVPRANRTATSCKDTAGMPKYPQICSQNNLRACCIFLCASCVAFFA